MADTLFGSGNAFSGFLEAEPTAAYYSSPAGWAGQGAFAQGSPNQRRYYQNQFQNIYNEFLGALGSQIRPEGGEPNLLFSEYLEDIPWAAKYAALTPDMAGRRTSRFSPGTRQIYF